VPFRYQSGDEIIKGDRVLFHGQPGEIEAIADPLVKDPETDWFMQEYGGGVMVSEPKVSGRVFVTDTEDEEDLILVSRSTDESSVAKS
jgi:hypothetical protein